MDQRPQQLPEGIRVVVFDVGETLVNESRMWARQANSAGVAPFTLMGLIGALIERDEPHHKAWDILGVGRPTIGVPIRSIDLYSDALDCLSATKDAGFVVGIAGNQPAGATACLRNLGFEADFVASSAEWGVSKPSPAFFSRIADVSGSEPREILYVGDRLDNDVLPAAAVGLRTALMRRGPWGQIHSRRADSVHADLRVDSLNELASLVRAESLGAPAEPTTGDRKHDPLIRTVRTADAVRLVDLFDDLSHPATADQILARVSRLLGDDTYMMWVAENTEDGFDGLAAGHILFPVEDDAPAAQLIALVTSRRARGTGLGARLCHAFEDWARSQGALRGVVNSGADRHSAHAFYRHLGWERTGARFGKRLADSV